jgi:alpha-galactosidase
MKNIKIDETNDFLEGTNGKFMFKFDKTKKTYDLIDELTSQSIISDAFYEIAIKINGKPLKISSKDEAPLQWDIEDVSNELGAGKILIIQQNGPVFLIKFKIYLYNDIEPIFLQISLEPKIDSLNLELVKLLIVNNENISVNTSNQLKILKNDWQSWSPIELVDLNYKNKRSNVKVERRSKHSSAQKPPAREIWSDYFSLIRNLQSQDQIFLGFVTLANQLAQIRWRVKKKEKIERIECLCLCDSILIEKEDSFDSEILMFSNEKNQNILESWARITGALMRKGEFSRTPPVGWCSWYYYWNGINEEKMALNIEAAQKLREKTPLQYIQMDDGYEPHNALGDWLETEPKKFPNGLKNLVQKIKAAGFKAGIWLAPFLITSNSKLFKDHNNWIIHDTKGKPLWGAWPFLGASSFLSAIFKDRVYALDLTHPEVQTWLRDLFKTLVDEIGFEYLKIDFIYGGAMEGVRYNRKMTRIQAYRKGLEIIREAVGEDTFILGCGAPFGPSIGIVDAIRTSTDTAPTFKVPFLLNFINKLLFANLETIPSVEHAMQQNILRYFFHNQFWINDPDALIVRRRESHLTPTEIQFEVSAIGLLGGLLFLSDNLASLLPNEIELIQILIPPYGISARPLDLLEHNFPEILVLDVHTDFDDWKIVGVFNWNKKAKIFSLDLNKIFNSNEEKYHVFEFWDKKYFGIHKKTFQTDLINPHSSKLFAIHEVKDVPTLLSSSFHITQGGLEVTQFLFNSDSNSLHITLEKLGNNKGNLYIYLPESLQTPQIDFEGSGKEIIMKDNILILNLEFQNETQITINLGSTA